MENVDNSNLVTPLRSASKMGVNAKNIPVTPMSVTREAARLAKLRNTESKRNKAIEAKNEWKKEIEQQKTLKERMARQKQERLRKIAAITTSQRKKNSERRAGM